MAQYSCLRLINIARVLVYSKRYHFDTNFCFQLFDFCLYNCLECKNFARISLLKVLSFWCQKNLLSLSIPLLLEVLCMEQPDDNFLKFFLLNMCSPRTTALLVPAYFMFIQEILIDGFVLKKEFQ